MRIQILASALVCAILAHGQSFKYNWANNCFTNSSSPVCKGHDFAVKPVKGGASRKAAASGFPSATGGGTAARMVDGDIDWRFSGPQPDALAGFHVSSLSASPLARALIAQLAARQNLTDADMRKVFEGLAGVDQIALSIRDNRVVVMVTGRVKDLTLPPPDGELKAVLLSENAMLFGHADAVDQAAQRIATPASASVSTTGSPNGLAEFAAERQAGSEFWAIGSGLMVGPEAVSERLQRFSLMMSAGDRLASDFAFEFDGPPGAKTLQTWQATLGAATLEGNVIHSSGSMEGDEARQKFGRIVASPLGERLAALVAAARSLPARDLNVLKQTRPVIYGLEGGPRVVGQEPNP